MPITVNIILMSGDVLPISLPSRNGRIKFLTAMKRMAPIVYAHLNLNQDDWMIKWTHDDDEDRRNAIVPPTGFELSFETRLALDERIRRERVYEDGDTVYAILNEFNLRRAWDELTDSEDED